MLRLIKFITRRISGFYYKYTMGAFGRRSVIDSPLRIDGAKNIFIGSKVWIQYKSWIASTPVGGASSRLVIEDGCTIGNFNHIYAVGSIILHSNVLTADKVYISDNLHGYSNPQVPIKEQPIVQKKPVEIGEGSWLGENVCVISASIGKHCVIGANSTVTKDIPDYSVAVGSPAKVIKRYNFENKRWEKI